jgi:hypothetical protein
VAELADLGLGYRPARAQLGDGPGAQTSTSKAPSL